MSLKKRSGGQILVDQLLLHGADRLFGVPGESFLAALDALHDAKDRLPFISNRHECGAANMAEAYGKLTGRPGICFVTRGPGACHAAIGVHTAFQDSTPMILLIGQVPREHADREAFQEVDYRQMFAPLAKWSAQVESAERLPEYIARAFHLATSGRSGPVVLSLPEDMLTDEVEVADPPHYVASRAAPSSTDLEKLRALLDKAKRPLLMVGGPGWTDAACKNITTFAEAWNIPVAASYRGIDIVSNRSAVYAGEFSLAPGAVLMKDIRECDVLLVVGPRLGEMTTLAYSTLDAPMPKPALIHIHGSADELGRVYHPTLGITAAPAEAAAALEELKPAKPTGWSAWTKEARDGYLSTLEPTPYNGALDMGRALADLRDHLPPEVIITVDAGNHTGWPQRYLMFGRPGRFLGPTNGAMGYCVPAAVAASLVHPERLVIGCVGDGGFQMTGNELATAIQHGAKPIILIFNNGIYGTIRAHQERHYPERVVATDLVNPDFVALARAYGCHAELVERTDQFKPAFDRAVASGKAAVIELRTDPEMISTRTTITALREGARAKQKASSGL